MAPVAESKVECKTALGLALRKLRMSAYWEQKQLAEAAGLDRSYLSDIERGLHSPTVDVVYRLVRLLDVSLEELGREVDANL